MPTITLPDGKTKSFDKPVTGLEIAASIGAGLAKAALAIKVDFGSGGGFETWDLSRSIDRDAKVALITAAKPGQPTSPEALALMRHSAAHVMAEAIQDVIGKDVLLAYGPATDTGFFYDMFVPAGKKISTDHFEKINARMAEIIKEDRGFARYELPATARAGATQLGIDKLHYEGNKYKLDNAIRALENIAKQNPDRARGSLSRRKHRLPPSPSQRTRQTIVLRHRYTRQELGRSLPRPARAQHRPHRCGVCAQSLASSYWHGDENSDRLTRVYGTAFSTQAELDAVSQAEGRGREARPPRDRQEPAALPHR
jgi:threonyl-tRNA synthetase